MNGKLKCPLNYGCNAELEEKIIKGIKIYRCPVCQIEFCEHILNATEKNINDFACGNCESPITECDCFDCGAGVFCSRCNAFINISCSDVATIIYRNSARKPTVLTVG